MDNICIKLHKIHLLKLAPASRSMPEPKALQRALLMSYKPMFSQHLLEK